MYRDIVVVCAPPEYTDENPASLLNPTLIVEVISPSTGDRDRSEKLEAYAQLASVQAYWIIEQDRPFAVCFERLDTGWLSHLVSGWETELVSDGVGVRISMRDVYDQVDFPE